MNSEMGGITVNPHKPLLASMPHMCTHSRSEAVPRLVMFAVLFQCAEVKAVGDDKMMSLLTFKCTLGVHLKVLELSEKASESVAT